VQNTISPLVDDVVEINVLEENPPWRQLSGKRCSAFSEPKVFVTRRGEGEA
jgi:hypothetical protein